MDTNFPQSLSIKKNKNSKKIPNSKYYFKVFVA